MLRAEGHEIRDEDVARLSPLKHKNLNVLGRYSFTPTQPAGGTLPPLRDPDAAGFDDDEDGAENRRRQVPTRRTDQLVSRRLGQPLRSRDGLPPRGPEATTAWL
ncbi:hypothetical protein [Streptomyces sp. NPDC001315]|uniref:hypothetical protein n=1 Tax=Streptomyces sp. NPDC001315 TaxID=3364562 RepID=UPI003680BED0